MPRQFQLRTLLIVVALCAFGTWWVIRPRQTAHWFVTEGYKAISLDDENWERASFRQMIERDPAKVVVTPGKRSWHDYLVGRQTFFVTGERGRYRFEVVKGQVAGDPQYAPTYGGATLQLDVF